MEPGDLTRGQAYTLYLCHFLSTWNARSYEFASVRLREADFVMFL
jgi:hypothetical protein